jgi:HEAT repeat protein
MNFAKALGVSMFLCCVGFLLAGGGVGTPKKEDVPKYMAQLKSASAADRAKAVEMLGKRGGISVSDVTEAVDPLRKLLEKDKDAKVRAACARALGDIQTDAAGTVPLLIDRVKADGEEKPVKMAAVVALGQFGPDAKDALPVLRDYLKQFDAKKSTDAKTIQASIQLISMTKKKKT